MKNLFYKNAVIAFSELSANIELPWHKEDCMVNRAIVDTGDTSSSRDLHSKLNGPIRTDNRMTISTWINKRLPRLVIAGD